MARDWIVELQAEFVPCPPEKAAAYWASYDLIYKWLRQAYERKLAREQAGRESGEVPDTTSKEVDA